MASLYPERKIWTTGRRGCVACITVIVYPYSIVATAETEQLTSRMMKKALDKVWPKHHFYGYEDGDMWRADADRWIGDGAYEALPLEDPDGRASG